MNDLAIVAAYDANRAIGRKGAIPWHLPSDLRFFRNLTDRSAVIMGRKTWESLPKRPLAGRLNVILTKNPRFRADGAIIARNLDQALSFVEGIARPFVIGGEHVYAEALPIANILILTEVLARFEGCDAHFPAVDPREWTVVRSYQYHERGESAAACKIVMIRTSALLDVDTTEDL